jgi:hypothetical protein
MENIDRLFDFLYQHGFKLSDKSTPPQPFGNFYYTFSNGSIEFRIVHDRGDEFIEVRNIIACEWHSLASVEEVIKNQYIESYPDWAEQINILIDNYKTIVDLFSRNNLEKTVHYMRDFGRQHFIQRFGDDFIKK